MAEHDPMCAQGPFCRCPHDVQCSAVIIATDYYVYVNRCTLAPVHPEEEHATVINNVDTRWADGGRDGVTWR